MHHNYQQFDLQTLIDLLAEETEKYTKAFISGRLQDGDYHREIIDSLVEEIHTRKQGAILPNTDGNDLKMSNNFPCC
jgi:hypothetical protein